MKSHFILYIFIFICCATRPAYSRIGTVWVSPDSYDGDCTQNSPCSLSNLTTLNTINTIFFSPGSYSVSPDGFAMKYADLLAWNGADVNINCGGGNGFIFIDGTYSNIISNINFYNCSCAINATETHTRDIKISVTNSKFFDCQYGIVAKEQLSVTNSTFSNNNIAIKVDGNATSNLYIAFSNFTSNGKSSEEAGAVVTSVSTLSISNCIFDDNTGGQAGGAVLTTSQNISIDNSVFTRNTAISGGALMIEGGYTINISNCVFERNTATYGGAINSDSGSADFGYGQVLLRISSSTFRYNKGILGGAMIVNADLTVILSSSFTQNRATYGGAVYCDTPIKFVMSEFTSNVAESGWVLMSKGKTLVSFDKCSIQGNYGVFSKINDGGKGIEVVPYPRYECAALFNSLLCGNKTTFENYNGYIWDLSKIDRTCLMVPSSFPCSCVSRAYGSNSCSISSAGIVTDSGALATNVSFTQMFLEPFVGEIGSNEGNPGVSCKDIYRKRGDLGRGVFFISLRDAVFPVLCDSSIFPGQVATLLFKLSSGLRGDPYKLLSLPFLNPSNNTVLSTNKSDIQYVGYLNQFWDRFSNTSVRLYTNEKNVSYIDFQSKNSSSPFGFFNAKNVIQSSWNDVRAAQTFAIAAADKNYRRFYVGDRLVQDCSTGGGWLMAIAENDTCDKQYFSNRPGLKIFYSPYAHKASSFNNFTFADVLAIWVKDDYYEASDAPLFSPYTPVPPSHLPTPLPTPPDTPKHQPNASVILLATFLPLILLSGLSVVIYFIYSHRKNTYSKYMQGDHSFMPGRRTSLLSFGKIIPQNHTPASKETKDNEMDTAQKPIQRVVSPGLTSPRLESINSLNTYDNFPRTAPNLQYTTPGIELTQHVAPKEETAQYVSNILSLMPNMSAMRPTTLLVPSQPPASAKKRVPGHMRPRPQRELSLIFGVTVGPIIGKGAFGAVYQGTWNGAKVAIKSITSQDFSDLYNEAIVLRSMRHPNIVQFYGLFDSEDKHYIVTEFVEGGSLDTLLKAKPKFFTLRDLVGLARDAAWGMQLLEQKKVLHRDLAARNLLVDLTRQQMTARVADFGMSRVSETFVAPPNTLIPIKWSAPEVLRDRSYTSKSDVWSMGIVIWEMLQRGEEPWAYIGNREAKENILTGKRLIIPPSTPARLKDLINKCWAMEPADRPTFVEIAEELTRVLDEITDKVQSTGNELGITPSASSRNSIYDDESSPSSLGQGLNQQGQQKTQEAVGNLDLLRECAAACARESEALGHAFVNNCLNEEDDPLRFYKLGAKSKFKLHLQVPENRRPSLPTIPEEEERPETPRRPASEPSESAMIASQANLESKGLKRSPNPVTIVPPTVPQFYDFTSSPAISGSYDLPDLNVPKEMTSKPISPQNTLCVRPMPVRTARGSLLALEQLYQDVPALPDRVALAQPDKAQSTTPCETPVYLLDPVDFECGSPNIRKSRQRVLTGARNNARSPVKTSSPVNAINADPSSFDFSSESSSEHDIDETEDDTSKSLRYVLSPPALTPHWKTPLTSPVLAQTISAGNPVF